jgi:hypothetical protein
MTFAVIRNSFSIGGKPRLSQKSPQFLFQGACHLAPVLLALVAAAGPFSSLTSRCYDAGTISYSAFIYDSAARGYRKLLLYQAGDWAQKNESDAGIKPTNWLMSIDSVGNDDVPCRPEGE